MSDEGFRFIILWFLLFSININLWVISDKLDKRNRK